VPSWQLELQLPPPSERCFELWLQHAAGRIFFEDVRGYALGQIDRSLSIEAQAAAEKAVDDAVYGLMMVIDGVSGSLRNEHQSVEITVAAQLVNREAGEVAATLDLRTGDGMCMAYHGWAQGDYGDHPVAIPRSQSAGDASPSFEPTHKGRARGPRGAVVNHAPSASIELSNQRASPHVIAIEPWGEDFTLMPGEELEVVAFGGERIPWFHVVEWDGATQVYCEGAVDFRVLQAGVQLECGHNRQPESAGQVAR
jgi:hypothetical protein